MIGRGLIARPDLARQIRASQQGLTVPELTWPEVVTLIEDYAAALQTRLEDRYVTGRIKQWLNYLRTGFQEAQVLWPAARKIRDVQPMLSCLQQTPDTKAA